MNKPISLKNQKEFNEVNSMGKKLHGTHFIAIISKSDGQLHLGLKVSRKMGNAVKRNKIRRWFKELTKLTTKNIASITGCKIILIPKKSIISITYQTLLKDFESVFRQFL